MSQPTLVVLAAGMGSRYGGLKQIDPVGPSGEIVIDYSIYDAMRAGFGKVVFIIRHDIEAAFREAVGRKFEGRIAVDYAFQELSNVPAWFTVPATRQKPWGTAHAMLQAEQVVQGNFAVINADDFYGASAYGILSRQLQTARDGALGEYAMVGFVLRQTLSEFGTVARGLCQRDPAGYLRDVVEVTAIEKDGQGGRYRGADGAMVRLTGDEIVSMNMWGFTPSIFGHLHRLIEDFLRARGGEEKSEFYIPTAVDLLIKAQQARCAVLSSSDSWFGVTYRDDKPHVVASIRALVDRGVYPENLWA